MLHMIWDHGSPFHTLNRDVWGYFASGMVLLTFCMKSMRWLRMAAIISNLTFIYYAAVAGIHPVLVLHGILLPLNAFRLLQIELARWWARSPPSCG